MAQNHKFSNYAGFRPFTRTYAIFHLGRRSGHIAAHQTSQSPRYEGSGHHRPRQYVRRQELPRRRHRCGHQAYSGMRNLRRAQPLRKGQGREGGRSPDSAGQKPNGLPQSLQDRILLLYRRILLQAPYRQETAGTIPRGIDLLLGMSGRRSSPGHHAQRHGGG